MSSYFHIQNHHSLSLPIISHGVNVRRPIATPTQLTFTPGTSPVHKQAFSSFLPYCSSQKKEVPYKYLLSVLAI